MMISTSRNARFGSSLFQNVLDSNGIQHCIHISCSRNALTPLCWKLPQVAFYSQKVPDPSLIWYHLYDSKTGKPYMGTSADKISVPSSADIADFRDAVKAKNPNKLSSVDAADLLVFKNKAAFDKRDALDEKVINLHLMLRKNRWKKILLLMDLEHQRRKRSLSLSHHQPALL